MYKKQKSGRVNNTRVRLHTNDNPEVEQAGFTWLDLDSIINNNGRDKEILKHIFQAKIAFNNNKKKDTIHFQER